MTYSDGVERAWKYCDFFVRHNGELDPYFERVHILGCVPGHA
jgi:hypothetical protein